MASEEPGPGREAGGGTLRLRRRRPPRGSGGEEGAAGAAALPGRPPTCASSSSWFQKQDLSNSEGLWMTLLRTVEPHLNHSSLEKIDNFPPFLAKNAGSGDIDEAVAVRNANKTKPNMENSSQTANPQAKPEMFNTGMKEFQWVPFPRYQREDTKESNSRRHQNSENEIANLIERENDEDEIPTVISPFPERKSSTASEHTSQVSKMNCSIKYSTQLECGERFETCQHTNPQNSPGHSSLTPVQSHLKEFEKLWERCSVQDEVESRRENGRENPSNNDTHVQHSTLFNEATSILPAQDLHSSSLSDQGKTENHREENPTLEKCPLCQMCFTGVWSELDVDSHLAKCLSESADDVVW